MEQRGTEAHGHCCLPPSAEQHAGASRPVPSGDAREAREETLARMVPMPGGTFLMGADDPDGIPEDGEGPVRTVTLDPFLIDRSPVTNTQFAKFVAATGYRTEAEQFGFSFVFSGHIPHERYHELVEDTVAAAPWWCVVRGAQWNTPEGPGSDVKQRGDHPVVHVSWNDAEAYCRWSGQRLPTEAEWEYAARGGLTQQRYPWGDSLRPEGEHRCNVWQGDFPHHDTGEDGFRGTCPVNAFPPNGFGLFSMTGNTWEWCADWFGTNHHSAASFNPGGPSSSDAKVLKGGSFLCHASYCNRYRVGARSRNTPDSSTANIGFRCVLSA